MPCDCNSVILVVSVVFILRFILQLTTSLPLNQLLKTAESIANTILTWDTDDECEDGETIEISVEAALLSDSSNSNNQDSDNDECTSRTTNQ